jgi:hypothetical protein
MFARALTLLGPAVLIRGVSRTRAAPNIFERPAYTLEQRETLFADDATRLFPKRLKGAHNHTFCNVSSQKQQGLPLTFLWFKIFGFPGLIRTRLPWLFL